VPRRGVAGVVKRAFDIAVAAGVLLALSPLITLIAVAIKLDDRGPVFFRQQRVGRGGRLFGCVKFRTMVCGAEWMAEGFTVTASDRRVTRVGRVLRLWTLDEIPQLFNVVRGDMSIVGPRPWVAEQAAHCSATERRRFDVRPGMAGWAWIHGRNRLEWDERIRLDAWYVDHWSLALDFRILARAFVLLFRRDGVYFEPAQASRRPLAKVESRARRRTRTGLAAKSTTVRP
jgi:lipopolysaccharide/colanic/teichoic acid biosynthesis glycosyltransferase